MKKILMVILIFVQFGLLIQAESVKKIVLIGNRKVSRDAVLFYLKTQENGVYSEKLLGEDFKTLWNTGFFKNIKIESENFDGGKKVVFTFVENPVISKITYNTDKKFGEKDINEKLQEKDITLATYTYYHPFKIKRIQAIIYEMLFEKSFNNGKVSIDVKENKDKNSVELTINVKKGSKTKIGKITFPGINKKYISGGFLRRGMKNNRVHSLISAVMGKDSFNKDKIEEDLKEVTLRLRQKGFLEAKVGSPEFSYFLKKDIFGAVKKMMRIDIPVDLGPKYYFRNLNVEGNKIVRTEFLRRFITLKKDKVYNLKKRNKNIEEMRKFYGSIGYFYCQVVPEENLDPEKKSVDLTIKIHEGDITYLGKLEFKGNTFTKDHVIRREWFLREGKVLNANLLEASITRMKQLGLVTIEKMPDIKPDPNDPQRINITAEVKEMNRQMINFNLGYSGYDGWFIALGYQTQNFLGMGESFGITIQTGTRTKNYSLSFTEPRIFHLPASLGMTVYKRKMRYPYMYTSDGQGFNISTSARFWRFWGTSLLYSFEDTTISDVNDDISFSNSYLSYYYTDGKRKISSLSPTLYYSTVDSPLFPTRGIKFLLNYRFSGGFLGGTLNLHKVKFQFTKFIKIPRTTHVFGVNFVYQGLKGFGDNQIIPFYENYFLGGERSIRGFDVYRIGPRNENGAVIGGDKAFFLNVEYRIHLNEQISFNFFGDFGNSYAPYQSIDLKNIYSSMGAELKIFVPMLNVPFRLIFAYNPRVLYADDNNYVFKFAIGPSF